MYDAVPANSKPAPVLEQSLFHCAFSISTKGTWCFFKVYAATNPQGPAPAITMGSCCDDASAAALVVPVASSFAGATMVLDVKSMTFFGLGGSADYDSYRIDIIVNRRGAESLTILMMIYFVFFCGTSDSLVTNISRNQ